MQLIDRINMGGRPKKEGGSNDLHRHSIHRSSFRFDEFDEPELRKPVMMLVVTINIFPKIIIQPFWMDENDVTLIYNQGIMTCCWIVS
jgi:hypothetical protein